MLHEEVRAQLLERWHAARTEECRGLSERLARYFEQTEKTREDDFDARAEALYHLLAAEGDAGFAQFQKEIEETIARWQLSRAEYLLNLAEEQAWALGKESKQWLRSLKADIQLTASRFENALSILNQLEVEDLAPRLHGTVLLTKGQVYKGMGMYKFALKHFREALPFAEQSHDSKLQSQVLDSLGDFYLDDEAFETALEYAQRGLGLAEQIGDERQVATVLRSIGAIYRQSGKEKEAIEYYTRSLEIRQQLGDEWGISDCLNSLALIHESHGEYQKALENEMKAIEIAERLGDRGNLIVHLQVAAAIYKLQKDYAKALEALARALDISMQIGASDSQARTLRNLAEIYTAQEPPNYDEAIALGLDRK